MNRRLPNGSIDLEHRGAVDLSDDAVSGPVPASLSGDDNGRQGAGDSVAARPEAVRRRGAPARARAGDRGAGRAPSDGCGSSRAQSATRSNWATTPEICTGGSDSRAKLCLVAHGSARWTIICAARRHDSVTAASSRIAGRRGRDLVDDRSPSRSMHATCAIWQRDFPSGIFAFSNGVEGLSAHEHAGWTGADCRDCVAMFLRHRWATSDRVALALSHRAKGELDASCRNRSCRRGLNVCRSRCATDRGETAAPFWHLMCGLATPRRYGAARALIGDG